MLIVYTHQFKKDLKKLSKKYPSVVDDLEIFERALIHNPTGKDTNKHWNEISDIGNIFNTLSFFKVRMMCRSLKGTHLRVIYTYDNAIDEISLIELYYKSNKVNYNKSRIDAVISTYSKNNS